MSFSEHSLNGLAETITQDGWGIVEMLDVVSASPQSMRRPPSQLDQLQQTLDLHNDQLGRWREFESTFEEIQHALEAIDAIASIQARDRAPALTEMLELQSRCLAIRLGATRRLAMVAADLLASLTPRQREGAERRLPALFRRVGLAPSEGR